MKLPYTGLGEFAHTRCPKLGSNAIAHPRINRYDNELLILLAIILISILLQHDYSLVVVFHERS